MNSNSLAPFLPYLALAVAAVSASLAGKGEKPRSAPGVAAYAVLALLVGSAIGAASVWRGSAPSAMDAAVGFGFGAVAAAIAEFLADFLKRGFASIGATLGIAAAACATGSLFSPDGVAAIVFGGAAAAWLLRLNRTDSNDGAAIAAMAMGIFMAGDVLGGMGESPVLVAGSLFGAVACLACAIVGAMAPKDGSVQPSSVFLLVALLSGFGWVMTQFVLEGRGTLQPWVLGTIVALVVSWLLVSETSARRALAAVIWLATATAAFSLEQGYGMAVTLIAATITLAAIRKDALPTLAPLAALVIYRLFRESHPAQTLSFDINQHYAMLGVLAGALLPLLAQEWLDGTGVAPNARRWIAGCLWILSIGFIPPVAAVLLGGKGLIGLMVGLGIGPVAAALGKGRSLVTMSVAIGLASVIVAAYPWLEPLLDLTRQEKLSVLAVLGGALTVLALAIGALGWGVSRSTAEVAS